MPDEAGATPRPLAAAPPLAAPLAAAAPLAPPRPGGVVETGAAPLGRKQHIIKWENDENISKMVHLKHVKSKCIDNG